MVALCQPQASPVGGYPKQPPPAALRQAQMAAQVGLAETGPGVTFQPWLAGKSSI